MTPHLDSRPLFSSLLVKIFDVTCRVRDKGCGQEEHVNGSAMIFPRAGAFMAHRGSRTILADPNHVVFFNREEPYRVSHPATPGDDCTTFFFRRNLISEIFSASEESRDSFPVSSSPIGPALSLQMHSLRRLLMWQPPDVLRGEELSLDLLRNVAGRVKLQVPEPSNLKRSTREERRDLVLSVQALLAARFQDSLSLPLIAREVGSSVYHLCRIFRAGTGMAIHQYRSRLRLVTALERISGGESDLTMLALDLGYASHSHFSDSFRRAFGMSPSRYRKISPRAARRELSKKLEDPHGSFR